MNSIIILIVCISVSGVLSKEVSLESDLQNEEHQPSTTLSDEEIVALIEKELNDRKHFRLDVDGEEFLSSGTSEPVDFDMSSTELFSTDYDDFDIFSTDLSSTEYDFAEFSSTESLEPSDITKPKRQQRFEHNVDETDNTYNVVEAAWNTFGGDIAAILKTMDKLNNAINSLDADYEEYGHDITYHEMIQDIENKMKELLESYKDIYGETNELIEMIKEVYINGINYNDNLRRLLSLAELINDQIPNIEEVDYKASETFGDDIDAINITMERIRLGMDELLDWNIDDEYKTHLSDKMSLLLDHYNDVIINTNELIELIDMFYLMMQK